ncbi:MAG: ATP-binding protein [Bacteroidales bacterium]|nr:ATP-binding protein [Bacteroidales bacterium]
MKKSFIYGVAVEGNNFTDREKETRRLKQDFENGQNMILISPRRMGKTSLVRKVQTLVDKKSIVTVYMDIYDCRNEYEFYNKFAASLMKQTAGKAEAVMKNIKEFLVRLSPTLSFGPDPNNELSVSLGITPKDYSPEEILQLPERMAEKMGKHIVVCIDEFQQIGEFPDSLKVQKKMRGIWQLQNNASYCLFGSKKHLLTNLFQSKKMPFYQFGDIMFLQPIPTEDWIPFIRQKFEEKKMSISDALIEKICSTVQNQSSYVQQLAWNVMLNTTKKADEATLETAIEDLLNQNSLLFLQQIENLTAYQMNFLKAVAKGVHTDFTSKEVLSTYDLGSKSNVSRIKTVLTQKELIEKTPNGIVLTDPVFELWFTKEWCE